MDVVLFWGWFSFFFFAGWMALFVLVLVVFGQTKCCKQQDHCLRQSVMDTPNHIKTLIVFVRFLTFVNFFLLSFVCVLCVCVCVCVCWLFWHRPQSHATNTINQDNDEMRQWTVKKVCCKANETGNWIQWNGVGWGDDRGQVGDGGGGWGCSWWRFSLKTFMPTVAGYNVDTPNVCEKRRCKFKDSSLPPPLSSSSSCLSHTNTIDIPVQHWANKSLVRLQPLVSDSSPFLLPFLLHLQRG